MTTTRKDAAAALSRRRFLASGALLAAGAATIGRPGAASAEHAPAPVSPQPAAPPSLELPPPIDRAAYAGRLQAARELLKKAQIPALVETPGSSLRYLTGLTVGRSERLIALVLPADGEPLLIGPAFERELIASSPAGIQRVEVWEEHENPVELLASRLRKLDADKGQLAIAASAWYDDIAKIHAALPRLTFASSALIVGTLRERKSPEELALLQAAVDVVERAIDSALGEVRESMTEEDLGSILTARIRMMGARGGGLVQFGARSAVPHNPTSGRKLAAGDVILIDFGACVHGYWSDISRTVVFGRATGRMKLIHETIRRAQDYAIEQVRAGATGGVADQAARATLGARGFHDLFIHRLGHGIGLDGHEPPYLVKGGSVPLEPGNVVTVEPGVYTPGEYGIRIEDMVEVTRGTARLMSKPPDQLREL